MKFTNKQNLPQPLLTAVENDPYSRGDSRWSCSQLINPPRITLLQEWHDSEIEVDVADQIWALLGKIGHGILENVISSDAFREERLYADVKGVRISGQSDYFNGNVVDWKFTSVYTRVFGSRLPEYERQLNVYAWLWRQYGFEVTSLQVCEIYRDWRKGDAAKREDYPPQAQMLDIPLWSEEDQERYVTGRVEVLKEHENANAHDLPHCQPDEYWAQGEKWALMRKGRKTSIRNFDTEDAALAAQEIEERKKPGTYIEHRPARRVRCESYCNAAPWCNQWQDFLKEQGDDGSD